MGVIMDEDSYSDTEMFYHLGKDLGIHRKDIRILGYEALAGKTPTMRMNVIHDKDISWKGEILASEASDFLERPFDLLIGYFQVKNPSLNLLTAKSNAHFKVGLSGVDQRLFDLIVAVEVEKGTLFAREVVRYMQKLDKIGPLKKEQFSNL
jgi:hypothetical protein